MFFQHLLWKTEFDTTANRRKACQDRNSSHLIVHSPKFSTGVDNFVENVTHSLWVIRRHFDAVCGRVVHFGAPCTHFTFPKTHLTENLLLFFLKWCII